MNAKDSLWNLLKLITPQNHQSLIDFGVDVGREIID